VTSELLRETRTLGDAGGIDGDALVEGGRRGHDALFYCGGELREEVRSWREREVSCSA
jgi:hypothetical protein